MFAQEVRLWCWFGPSRSRITGVEIDVYYSSMRGANARNRRPQMVFIGPALFIGHE